VAQKMGKIQLKLRWYTIQLNQGRKK